jgi:hypothetical protein
MVRPVIPPPPQPKSASKNAEFQPALRGWIRAQSQLNGRRQSSFVRRGLLPALAPPPPPYETEVTWGNARMAHL